MSDQERLETIKEFVKKIESILYDEWRQQELTILIESLYYADHVDWLINRVEELEEGVKEAVSDIENISPHEAKKTLIDLIKNMEGET